MLFDLAGKDPQLMAVAGDLIVSQMDSPIAIQLRQRLEKALPPGLLGDPNDPNKDLPPEVQQRLAHDQQMIQQLTMTLQKETQLADKVQADMQAKIEVAKIEQQTALMKAQSDQHHSANLLAMKEQISELHMKHQQAHEIMSALQKHQLDTDKIHQKAIADMAVKSVGPEILPPQPIQPATYHAPKA